MGEMRREQRLTFLSILSAHGEGQAAPIGLKFPPARQGFGARGIFYRSSIKHYIVLRHYYYFSIKSLLRYLKSLNLKRLKMLYTYRKATN